MTMKPQKLLAALAVLMMTVSGATLAHAQDTATPAPMAPAADSTAAAAPAGTGMAATPASDNVKVSHKTKKFIEDASEANMFEIDSSKIAATKSANQQVKDFANKMITDHTKAGSDMTAAISSNPAEQALVATKESSKHQRILDNLNKDDAASFDKDYVNAQVDAHKDAVDLFTKYSDKGDDASLKTFATNTLPVLKQHQDMINSIKSSMK
jgi:putative membrane protein